MANDFGVSASFIDTELSFEPLEDGVELIWVTFFLVIDDFPTNTAIY